MPRSKQTPSAAALRARLAETAALLAGDDPVRESITTAAEAFGQQTYVGGKRVTRIDLPELPDSAASTVHLVKVSLYGAKPPIWRRLEIPSAMPLDMLHDVLQTTFDWDDCHLHAFETVCGEFGHPEQATDDDWPGRGDETAVSLAQVAAAEKDKVVYVYDFGDDWRHDIVVEKILPADPRTEYPRCTGGRGASPGEDSGGIWAHNDAIAAGQAGGRFDPAAVTRALTGDGQIQPTAPPSRESGVGPAKAQGMINALADPQALLIFGVIVGRTSTARTRDQFGMPARGISYITPFGLMKETHLSREEVERAAGLLKDAGLLDVLPDERGFENWRVSEAAIADASR